MSEGLDLLIIGAGPAGLAAAAQARLRDLRALVLERCQHVADTVTCYQRGKHVMAEPAIVPCRSQIPFESGSREAVLAGWQEFVSSQGLDIRFHQEVTAVQRADDGGFRTKTAKGDLYESSRVIVAVGTQGNPNRLGVPGEDLPHVKPRLVDPRDHDDQDIVVIGGGDSAIEIATALAESNRVTLVVRGDELVRAKDQLERDALACQEAGQLRILFRTTVERIETGLMRLHGPEEDLEVAADHVYVKIGAKPPRRFLESMGVAFASEDRDATPRLSRGFEAVGVSGLHLIGAVSGRDLIKHGMNQGWEVVEHVAGRDPVPADEEILLQKLTFGDGSVNRRISYLKHTIALFADTDADSIKDILLTVSHRPSMLLRAPTHDDLREAFLTVTMKRYPTGAEIVRQNDYSDSLLLLLEGSAKVYRRSEDGDERAIGELAGGSFFGEMGLLSGRRRTASVVAAEDCSIMELPRKTVLRLIVRSPRVRRLVDEAFLIRAFETYLFPGARDDVLKALAKTAITRQLDRDEVVFREGDRADALYFIRSGQVKLSKRSGDRELVLSYLVSGNFFGESGLFEGTARRATVTTIFPSELISVSRAPLQSFISQFPELMPRFREALERRRIDSLAASVKPGRFEILEELIRGEVVIGTDALIIDNYKCVRCNNCITACESVHEDGQARLSLSGIEFANILAPNSCWQCENPLCMIDCPPDALVRDSRGEIYIRDNCIGCGNCEANCPYDNIFMVHREQPRGLWGLLGSWLGGADSGSPQSDSTVAVKCDLCRDLAGGPACVRSCPTGAAVRLTPDQYEEEIGELVERGRRGG